MAIFIVLLPQQPAAQTSMAFLPPILGRPPVVSEKHCKGVTLHGESRYNDLVMLTVSDAAQLNPILHLPERWPYCLETRRYRANLPSRLRPSLFGSD